MRSLFLYADKESTGQKIANVFWTSFMVGPLSADRKNTNYIFRTRLNFIQTCAEAGHYIQNRAASKLSSSHLVPLFHQQSVSLMGVYHFFTVQQTSGLYFATLMGLSSN